MSQFLNNNAAMFGSTSRAGSAESAGSAVSRQSMISVHNEIASNTFKADRKSFYNTLWDSRNSLPKSKKTGLPVGNSGLKLLHTLSVACRHFCGNIPTRLHMMQMSVLDHVAKKMTIPEMDTEKVIEDGNSALYKTGPALSKEKLLELQTVTLPEFVENANVGINKVAREYGSKNKQGVRPSHNTEKDHAKTMISTFWKKRTQDKDRSTTFNYNDRDYKQVLSELWSNKLIQHSFKSKSTPEAVSDRAMNDLLTMYFSRTIVDRVPLKLVVVGKTAMGIIADARKGRSVVVQSGEDKKDMHVAVYYFLPRNSGVKMIDLMIAQYEKDDHKDERSNTRAELDALIKNNIQTVDVRSEREGLYVIPMTAMRLLMSSLRAFEGPSVRGKAPKRIPHLISHDDFITSLKVCFLSTYITTVKARIKYVMGRKEKDTEAAKAENEKRKESLDLFDRDMTHIVVKGSSRDLPAYQDVNNSFNAASSSKYQARGTVSNPGINSQPPGRRTGAPVMGGMFNQGSQQANSPSPDKQ